MLLMRTRNQEMVKRAGKLEFSEDFGKPVEIKEITFVAEAFN